MRAATAPAETAQPRAESARHTCPRSVPPGPPGRSGSRRQRQAHPRGACPLPARGAPPARARSIAPPKPLPTHLDVMLTEELHEQLLLSVRQITEINERQRRRVHGLPSLGNYDRRRRRGRRVPNSPGRRRRRRGCARSPWSWRCAARLCVSTGRCCVQAKELGRDAIPASRARLSATATCRRATRAVAAEEKAAAQAIYEPSEEDFMQMRMSPLRLSYLPPPSSDVLVTSHVVGVLDNSACAA